MRPSRKVRAGHGAARSATTLHGRGRRRPRRGTPPRRAWCCRDGADVLDVLERHGEVPLPPYITTRAGRPRALPDHLRRSRRVGRRADRRAAPHAGAARRGARPPAPRSLPVELVVGLGTFRPDRDRARSRTTTCTPSATACPRPRWPRARRAERVVAIGTTTRAGARVGGGHGRARGPHRAVHPRRPAVRARRRAADELPPAPVVAARARRRLRRAPLARPLRRGARARATGSSASATPCSCAGERG